MEGSLPNASGSSEKIVGDLEQLQKQIANAIPDADHFSAVRCTAGSRFQQAGDCDNQMFENCSMLPKFTGDAAIEIVRDPALIGWTDAFGAAVRAS
jgi:hypothetical protein